MQAASSSLATDTFPSPTVSVESVIANVKDLVSMPDSAMRLATLLSDPHATTAEIAEIVSIDPSFSARLLRVASSPYFGLHVPVETIAQAVTVLGIRKLHLLALAASASHTFNKLSGHMVNLNAFWQHSVAAAVAAGSLASRGMRRHRDRIFLAALLHDVGQLVMYHQLPEISARIEEGMALGETRVDAEQGLLGFTHADLGAALLDLWHLPVSLTEPVRYHERCADAPNHGVEAAVVYLGSTIAHHIESRDALGTGSAGLLDVDSGIWALAGSDANELDEVIAEVDVNWFEVMNLIAPDSMMIP